MNSAGRLYRIYKELDSNESPNAQQQKRIQVKINDFCGICGIQSSSPRGAIAAVDMLWKEHGNLVQLVKESTSLSDNKRVLFLEDLKPISAAILSFNVRQPEGLVGFNIPDAALVSLRHMAADIDDFETEVSVSDFVDITNSISDLESLIVGSVKDLKLKAWLLDLATMMRSAVSQYRVRGSQAFREQLTMLMGEAVLSNELTEKTRQEAPNVFAKFSDVSSKMLAVVQLANATAPYAQVAGNEVLKLISRFTS